MFKRSFSIVLILSLSLISQIKSELNPKIVGLIQVCNEEFFIEQCLRALANYTDSIVIVDDVSDDNTVPIIESLKKEFNIEKLILNKENSWQKKSERYNRQLLLDAGRSVGGTHFIFIDADEIFSSDCLTNNWLRNQILSMKKGQVMFFYLINLWNGIDNYLINDEYNLENSYSSKKPIILCDDGQCNYNQNPCGCPSRKIHIGRIPDNPITENGVARDIWCRDIDKAIIHLNAVNIDRLFDKGVWYMCFEFIHTSKGKSESERQEIANAINHFYQVNKTLKFSAQIAPSRNIWFANYTSFSSDIYNIYSNKFRREVLAWFNEYGPDYFKDLDIWYLSWTDTARKSKIGKN